MIDIYVIACIVLGVLATVLAFDLRTKMYPVPKVPNGSPLVESDDLLTCKDPHEWALVTLMITGIEQGEYDVCLKCGTIAGHPGHVLKVETLENIKNSLRQMEENDKRREENAQKIDELTERYVDAYIQSNFEREINDVELADRLKELVRYAREARKLAGYKVLTQGSEDVEVNWTNPGGNA